MSSSENPEPENEWELACPFIVVKSKGGIYEDDAFTAGFALGALFSNFSKMPAGVAKFYDTLYTTLIDQADLLAMYFGWIMEIESQDEEWATLIFSKKLRSEQDDSQETQG